MKHIRQPHDDHFRPFSVISCYDPQRDSDRRLDKDREKSDLQGSPPAIDQSRKSIPAIGIRPQKMSLVRRHIDRRGDRIRLQLHHHGQSDQQQDLDDHHRHPRHCQFMVHKPFYSIMKIRTILLI